MSSAPHSATQALSGWGNWPVEPCHVYRPERRRDVAPLLGSDAECHYIARGLGRSYGDASIDPGGGVIDFVRLDRMLDFDEESGVLSCEAGVSLEDIIHTFLPRGWFLPVTPGTKFVTIGGAIANDVHGKNHHRDGTFSRFVPDLDLLVPSGEVLRCSPEANAEVFWATVGGVGLTGVILSARVRLKRVETAYLGVDYVRAANIDEALAALEESDQRREYSVAWVDCLARGAHLGRSVVMAGDHIGRAELSRAIKEPLAVRERRLPPVPFNFPAFALNPLSVNAFNTCYYACHPSAKGKVVDYDSFFYPLDAVGNWNRIYGKRGFTQYQATFPTGQAGALRHLLERLSESRRASFLAVLKRTGKAGPGLLSHPIEGYTLTLDMPVDKGLVAFLHELDAFLLHRGGRLYLAKDAAAKPETIAAMYPCLDAFRAVKARVDPQRRLSSRLARRLGLVESAAGGGDG